MLLGGTKWVFAIGYIDDIIVYSDTWVDHLAHLRQVFEALRKANLERHPGQCAFGAQEVNYLGRVVTRDGIWACPSTIKAMASMLKPASAKDMQRFTGKCQYYRKFIPKFSQIVAPLFKAQATRRNFAWTEASLGRESRKRWFPTLYWCSRTIIEIFLWTAMVPERAKVACSCRRMRKEKRWSRTRRGHC